MKSTELRDLRQRFDSTHHQRRLAIGGHAWTYRDGGSGDPPVVLLAGQGATDEVFFAVASRLADTHRVLSVGFPEGVTTAAAIVDGVAAICIDAGLAAFALLGHSQGGLAAQAFVASEHARRVRYLILANTGLMTGWRRHVLPVLSRALGRLPGQFCARQTRSQLQPMLRKAESAADWDAVLSDMFRDDSGPRLRAQYTALAGLAGQGPPYPQPWDGPHALGVHRLLPHRGRCRGLGGLRRGHRLGPSGRRHRAHPAGPRRDVRRQRFGPDPFGADGWPRLPLDASGWDAQTMSP